MAEKYNGWANYATWRVNLELLGDYCDSLARDGETFASISALSDRLKDYTDEAITNFGEITEGLALDYARSFVSDVNWHEIAEHWADDLVCSEEDEDGAS